MVLLRTAIAVLLTAGAAAQLVPPSTPNAVLNVHWGVLPGGFEEASCHTGGADRVYLKHRMGFVKYAIQHGYSLTPVFAFGERDTFANPQGAWSLRFRLNSFGIPAVVPFGKWWCPLLPRNDRMHVVVGEPIPHQQRMEAFHERAACYGTPQPELQ
eukprot:gene41978-1686_t